MRQWITALSGRQARWKQLGLETPAPNRAIDMDVFEMVNEGFPINAIGINWRGQERAGGDMIMALSLLWSHEIKRMGKPTSNVYEHMQVVYCSLLQ